MTGFFDKLPEISPKKQAPKLAGAGSVDVLSLANCLDAVVDVGGDEDIDHVLVITQHIVGGSAHKYAVALIGSLSDGIALELVQTFLREVVVIEIVIAQEATVQVVPYPQPSLRIWQEKWI